MLKTPDGWKAIEEFRAGDEIVSRPEHRPEAANTIRKVTRLLTRSGQVLDLWVQGRHIETTNEHPYWVVGQGWKTANTLQVGDTFLTSDNRRVVLERIEDHNRYVAVYNLEVEADHTYFVGGSGWGFDVWSHNHETETPTVYRGGANLSPRLGVDVIKGKDGLIHPTGKGGKPQGISLNSDPNNLFIQKYGGAYKVESVPEGLQIVQSGNPGHYVAAPKAPMTFEEIDFLSKLIKTIPPGG